MLNNTIIQGRFTRDPEMRATQSGTPVCGFTVAWSEKYGETEQKLFMPCVAWNKSAEFVRRYFTKGQEVIVEGKLVTRKWQDQHGNDRQTTELIVDHVHFCGKKETGSAPQGGYDPGPSGYDPGPGGFAPLPGEDSDLPF